METNKGIVVIVNNMGNIEIEEAIWIEEANNTLKKQSQKDFKQEYLYQYLQDSFESPENINKEETYSPEIDFDISDSNVICNF